ncbi:hypothetical protein TNCV_1548151 [Trichonephila clavipes]|nr:hypothetical protein TNCV_1548151 [Trichonephila clavipes]
MSARSVRLRLQQYGLSARKPWMPLPLTLHHRQERLQFASPSQYGGYEPWLVIKWVWFRVPNKAFMKSDIRQK